MNSLKRRLLILAMAVAGLGLAAAAGAQSYPSKPIKLIVPSAPGGSPDILSRLLAVPLAEALGQPVLVENVSGAAGIIGTDRVAKATPDGYTLLYGFNQVATMNPALYPKLPYQPERDLAPIALTLNLSYMWIAPTSFAPNTIAEVVATAKAKPGGIDYASTGPGSAAHLGGVLLEKLGGIQMVHIPYKGNTNSDLIAGVVQLKLDPVAASLGLVKSGKVKVLAVSAPKRLAVLPDVPTVAETLPGYDVTGWQGLWAPVGTPAPIIEKLNAAMVKVVQLPQIQHRILELGFEPLGSTPAEMAARIRQETVEWATLIKSAHISLEE
jgi:tripartite-type tricarboxylate transporter receptor subunit TctC